MVDQQLQVHVCVCMYVRVCVSVYGCVCVRMSVCAYLCGFGRVVCVREIEVDISSNASTGVCE